MIFVLAENLDSLSGGSGWVGAGLLGLVLAWLLLVHLPGKDKQIDRMIGDKDKIVDGLMTRHAQEQDKSRTDFKAALDTVVKHCDDEMVRIMASNKSG